MGNTTDCKRFKQKTPPSPLLGWFRAWHPKVTTCFTVTSPKEERCETNAGREEVTRNDFSAAYTYLKPRIP